VLPAQLYQPRANRGRRGVTLVELILGLVLTSLIMGVTLTFFSSLNKDIIRPVVVFGDQNYTLAPIINQNAGEVGKTDLFDAIDLHKEFTRLTSDADMVCVFGGSNKHNNSNVNNLIYAGVPLKKDFTKKSLTSIDSLKPYQLLIPQDVSNQAKNELVDQWEGKSDPADFTVLMFQGVAEIIGIAQVRRITTSNGAPKYEGANVVLYETLLKFRKVNDVDFTTYAYRFWLPEAEDKWDTAVGARHHWLRCEKREWDGWDRRELAGYTLVFPDPFVLSSVAAENATTLAPKSKSRFSYFVPTSPVY
jgi:hypothetical protein